MIDEAKAEKALLFLAESDDSFAAEKAAMEEAEILMKRIRARIFLVSYGTVAERQAKGETHHDTIAVDAEWIKSLTAYEKLKAKRQRAELTIDLFRTVSANQRRA